MSLDQQLDALEGSSLIRRFATQPELEYLFRHALIQDAAYATLLKKEQKRLHQIVGETLEALYPDRHEELVGLLAYHFGAAGERNKAVEYARQAARHSKARYAYEEAAQHLRSALELSEASGSSTQPVLGPSTPSGWGGSAGPGRGADEKQVQVLEELADVYLLLREGLRALPLLQRALEAVEQGPEADPVAEVRLHRKIIEAISITTWTVRIEEQDQAVSSSLVSRTSLEAALQRLVAQTPRAETVHLLRTLSYDAWRNRLPPDYEVAELHARVALEVAERLGDPTEISGALGSLANVHLARSLLREHLRVAQQRLEISAGAGFDDPAERVDSLRSAGGALMYVGEYDEALTYLEEAGQLAASIHAVAQQFNVLCLQAQCRLRLDQWNEVLGLEVDWRELVQRYSRERIGVT